MRRVVQPWLGVLLLCGACRCGPVVMGVDAQPLVVSPTELDFGAPFVGQRVSRVLTVRNPSTAARALEALVPAPFEGELPSAVPGGTSLEVTLSLTVVEPGLITAAFDVDGTRVSLTATGRPVPACAPSAPCRDAAFDLTSGRCEERVSSDDAACTTSCLTAGRCVSGACLGQSQACDDADQCTVDACGSSGCVHVPLSCPTPQPCQAARCDPSQGCVVDAVEDGVACGAEDCARNLAFVCINGACVPRQRPQGALCVEVLAGFPAGPGHIDGTGDSVRFDQLMVAATDAWGTTWLVSRYSIRKLTPGGVVSTVLRRGLNEQFLPNVATTDALGNLYFDEGRCVRKVTPLGATTRFGANCSTLGTTSIESILPARDGRLLLAWERTLYELDDAGIYQRVVSGRGPLQETSNGDVLFVNVDDAGARLSALSRDGGVTALRPWKGQFVRDPRTAPVPSVSAQGRAISVQELDGGCVLTVEAPDGAEVLRRPLGLTCYVANIGTTKRGGGWLGRDESIWFLDDSLQVSRLGDAGVERVVGFGERPGDADGHGADAGLRASGERAFGDFIAVRAAGVVSLVDLSPIFVSRLREWRDGAGLTTITDGGLNFRIAAMHPSDGGLWLYGSGGPTPEVWSWWSGVGEPSFSTTRTIATSTSFIPHGGVVDENGSWLFPGLARLNPQGDVVGVVSGGLGADLHRDGPLAPFLPDAGVSFPSATEAHFGLIAAAVPFGDGLALATTTSVRLLADGGMTTLAGQFDAGFLDGQGALAAFNDLRGIGWSSVKQVFYVADRNNFAIRSVDLSGQVRTVARLSDQPLALTVSDSGDVYVLVRHALLRAR